MTSHLEPNTRATPRPKTNVVVRALPVVARVLLGVFMLASGLADLLHLIPAPPNDLPESAIAFNAGMLKTGYMFPMVAGTQFFVGALLLLNRFVPLALALLAPFVVNALAFHLFLVPAGLLPALVLLALEVYLAWTYRGAFTPMLAVRVQPGT